MLRKKPYIEERKALSEKQLLERMETLKSIGMTDAQMLRDAQVKHFKGKIRQARLQLTGISDLEKLIVRKREIKAEKLAASKAPAPKKQHAKDPAKKKEKKERKIAAAGADE